MTEPKIIFEDDAIIVIDKPAGMTVNRADTTKDEVTVQDWLEKITNYELQITSDGQSDFYMRSGIVHRIDKETSGILLAAKTQEAFEELQRQFKERIVQKSYMALAHGVIVPPDGEISVPVGRLVFNRKRFGVVAGGREAVTKYKTITNYELQITNKEKEKLTLLEVYPKTGRTHQIRVHLKYLNHPIFSDELYAGRKTARNDRKLLPRLFLHAAKIMFVHPLSKEEVTFESKLPGELQEFLNQLEIIKVNH